MRICLKSYDHKTIDQACRKIIETALRNGSKITGPVPLPTRKKIYTVTRSPHVYKKSREQFEMRVHKRLIDIVNPNLKTIQSLQNISLPPGCDVDIKL